MRHTPITPQVRIPPIVLGPELVKLQIVKELIETFLALCAADDFADARDQDIHRGDRLAVVVQAHVKRFDLARVIEDRDW